MEKLFQISAVVLIASSAVFYLYGNIDGVFISIVLGCLSYFLSVRAQVKERLAEREAARMQLEDRIEAASIGEDARTGITEPLDR